MRKKKKHSANFYSDEHNLRRLRQLKIERKPMDFDKLKKHEESFLANVYIQREEKNKEMKDKLEKLQNSYEVKFKSKKYMEFSDHYMADRNHFTLEKEKNYKLHSSAKTYGKKVTEITNSVRNVQNKGVDNRFPKAGKEYMQWFYGRFGNKVFFETEDTIRSKNLNSIRYEKGLEYLSVAKELKMPQEQAEFKERERQKKFNELDMRSGKNIGSKSRAKSFDYLKSLRESRPKGFYNEYKKNNSVNIEKRLDQKAFIKRNANLNININKTSICVGKANIDVEKANYLIETFNEFDHLARSREKRINLFRKKQNDDAQSQKPTLLNKKAKTDDCSDYYLTAIKAKLSFLDEIKK